MPEREEGAHIHALAPQSRSITLPIRARALYVPWPLLLQLSSAGYVIQYDTCSVNPPFILTDKTVKEVDYKHLLQKSIWQLSLIHPVS